MIIHGLMKFICHITWDILAVWSFDANIPWWMFRLSIHHYFPKIETYISSLETHFVVHFHWKNQDKFSFALNFKMHCVYEEIVSSDEGISKFRNQIHEIDVELQTSVHVFPQLHNVVRSARSDIFVFQFKIYFLVLNLTCLPPAYVVRREGNALTRVCPSIHQSVCPREGGVSQPTQPGGGQSADSARRGSVSWLSQGGSVSRGGVGVSQPGSGWVSQLGRGGGQPR